MTQHRKACGLFCLETEVKLIIKSDFLSSTNPCVSNIWPTGQNSASKDPIRPAGWLVGVYNIKSGAAYVVFGLFCVFSTKKT